MKILREDGTKPTVQEVISWLVVESNGRTEHVENACENLAGLISVLLGGKFRLGREARNSYYRHEIT